MASPGIRLKRRAEFLRVAAKGAKAPMPGMVLQCLPRDDQSPAQLGFTVTKKVGNSVVRNRTRRKLREAARLLLRDRALAGEPIQGMDLVLIGRDGTRRRSLPALMDDLDRAIKRASRAVAAKPRGHAADEPDRAVAPEPRGNAADAP